MTQTALPASTISNNWDTLVGATAHEALQSSDGDTSKISTVTQGDICEVKVDSLTDPENNINHVITISAQATGSGGPERITFRLIENTTIRASSASTAITRGSYADYTYTLSTAEADTITDHTDLRIRIEATVLGSETLDVSFAKFEVDDAPTPSTGLQHMPQNQSLMI